MHRQLITTLLYLPPPGMSYVSTVVNPLLESEPLASIRHDPRSAPNILLRYTGKTAKSYAVSIPIVKKVVDHIEAQLVDTALVEEYEQLKTRLQQLEGDHSAKLAFLESRLEAGASNEQELRKEKERLAIKNAALQDENKVLQEEKHQLQEVATKAEQETAHANARLAEMQIAQEQEATAKAELQEQVVVLAQDNDALKLGLGGERKAREVENAAAKEEIETLKKDHRQELAVAHTALMGENAQLKIRLQQVEVNHNARLASFESRLETGATTERELEKDNERLTVKNSALEGENKALQEDNNQLQQDNRRLQDNMRQLQDDKDQLQKHIVEAEQETTEVNARLADAQIAHEQEAATRAGLEEKVTGLVQDRDTIKLQLGEERKAREVETEAAKEEIEAVKSDHRQELAVAFGQLQAAWDKASTVEGDLENNKGSLAAAEEQNRFLISENKKLQKRAYELQERVGALIEKAINQATKEVKVEKQEPLDFKTMLAKVQGGFVARDPQCPQTPTRAPLAGIQNQVVLPPTPQSPLARFH